LRPGRAAKTGGSSSCSTQLAQPASSTLINKVWALKHRSPYTEHAGRVRTNLKEKNACKHILPLDKSTNSSYNVAMPNPSSPAASLPRVGSASPRNFDSTVKSSSPSLEEMLASLDSKNSTVKQQRASLTSDSGSSFAYSGKVVITLKPDDMRAAVARDYSLTAPKWPRPQVRSTVVGARESSTNAAAATQARKSPVRSAKPVAKALQLAPLQQKQTDTKAKAATAAAAGYNRKDSASTADTAQLSSRSSSSFTDAEPAAAAVAAAAAGKKATKSSSAQATSGSKTAAASVAARPAQAAKRSNSQSSSAAMSTQQPVQSTNTANSAGEAATAAHTAVSSAVQTAVRRVSLTLPQQNAAAESTPVSSPVKAPPPPPPLPAQRRNSTSLSPKAQHSSSSSSGGGGLLQSVVAGKGGLRKVDAPLERDKLLIEEQRAASLAADSAELNAVNDELQCLLDSGLQVAAEDYIEVTAEPFFAATSSCSSSAPTSPVRPAAAAVLAAPLSPQQPVLLGKGRFATVAVATDAAGRRVALKQFRYVRDAPPLAVLKSVAVEASMLHKLKRCPAVIELIGMWLQPRPCLVLELLEDGSLHNVLVPAQQQHEAQPRTVQARHLWLTAAGAKRLQLLQQVAAGLASMHSCGIAHRDIKSHNILVSLQDATAATAVVAANGTSSSTSTSSDWVAKIGDLGSAAELSCTGSSNLISSACLEGQAGTSGWSAPETYSGALYSAACDVFSFGVLLWEGAVSCSSTTSSTDSSSSSSSSSNAAAVNPLCGLADEDSAAALAAGVRPPVPAVNAYGLDTQVLAEFLGQLWAQPPSERPTAAAAAQRLAELLAGMHVHTST
jgi:serine/threonine protein kinase